MYFIFLVTQYGCHNVLVTKHILMYVHTYLKALMQQWTANTVEFGKHFP